MKRKAKNKAAAGLLRLAAIAAAWSMHIGPDLIAAGIKTFELEPR